MHKLSIDDIITNIESEIAFEAVSEDYAFTIKIEDYAPHICAAVHDGHQFRKSLWEYCTHTEFERWYEEDPCTKEMIQGQPIVIAGRDSRFEYDLNRDSENAIYDDAWGKKLWYSPLSRNERALSLSKYDNFYRMVKALVTKVEQKHGKALVFDMHSYNRKRWDREVPTWNLGTTNIDTKRFGEQTASWCQKLSALQLPNNIPSTAKINDTFQGNGYFLKYITTNFRNTLVLATEIAKVYCDELSGIIFPEVVRSVADQLSKIIPQQAREFHNQG